MEIEQLLKQLPLIISFSIYLLVLLLIGIYFYSKNKNANDYFIGGRGLGPFVTALSAGASDMSSWLLLGLPGLMYSQGFISLWICLGLIIGSFLNWRLVAYRLRVLTEQMGNCITLPEFFAIRFEDKKHKSMIRIVSSMVILVFFTLYVSAGFVGGAKLFEGSFEIPYTTSLFVGGAVIIFYTFFGGYFAVSFTDVLQALLVSASLILFPIVILYEVGGIGNVLDIVQNSYPSRLNFYGGEITLLAVLSSMAWGLGYFGQPHIVTRFMSIKSENEIRKSTKIGMTWMIITLLGSTICAFLGIAYVHQYELLEESQKLLKLEDPEHIIIFLNKMILNPWIAGIVVSAILAAIMSTVDSQLLVSASSMSHDIYMYFFGKEENPATHEKSLMISRLAVLFIAIIAMLLSMNPDSKVLDLVSYAWAGFGATFGPTMFFALFWKKTTARAVIAGMLVGAITVLFWKHLNIIQIYEIIPGFIFASLTIFFVSLIDPVKVSETITKQLDMK